MLQRLFLKGSCLMTGNNGCLLFNQANGQVLMTIYSTSTFSQCLGGKAFASALTRVIPYSLETVVQLKLLTRITVRSIFKKTVASCRCKRISLVSRTRSLAWSTNRRFMNRQNLVDALQRFCRSNAKETRHLGRILLGSALFFPSTFLRDQDINDNAKNIPIEIPKETKIVRKVKPIVKLLVDIYELIRLFLRGLRLFVTFVPILTLYPVTYLGEKSEEAWWWLLLKVVEFSGPIPVKLGQWASTRRDLFPDSCCQRFARLQRRVQPHSWSFTKYRMRKAFGPHWRKVFVKFDNHSKPVGSGYIAQVYKVWMSTQGLPDQELLEEIIMDLDEDDNGLEGLEIQGFRNLVGGDDADKDQEQALLVWRQDREAERLKDKENEKELLSAKEYDQESSSGGLDVDISSVTESLASDIVSNEEFQPLNNNHNGEDVIENSCDADLEEVTEHSLVEVWNEADLDKSLPVEEEAPPDDLEGLIPVAVKVVHPHIYTAFRRDLRILKVCASFISSIYPPLRWLSLPECVDEFAEYMSGQINMKKEAENLEKFSENFIDVPSIRFPRPLRPYVTQKVMVETYEEGDAMCDFIGASGEDAPNDLKINLSRIAVDALLKMIFVDNFVHGDMHPGNIVIQNIRIKEDGVNEQSTGDVMRIMMVDVGCDTFVMDVQPDPNPLRICFFDCGSAARLKERDLMNFRAVFKQIVLGNAESVADLFLENSEHNCKDPESFKMALTELVETARQDTVSLAQVDVGILLQQLLGILLKHQIRLESAFSSVVLSVFLLEGLGRSLDPDMDILERARPMLVTG